MKQIRECGECTACCEGWLKGFSYDHYFQPGRPCHFKCDTGCTIYEDRPESPCKTYNCEWLTNLDFPEWFKPSLSKIIVTRMPWGDDGKYYLNIIEAGCKIDSIMLNWLFQYYHSTNIPINVQVSGGWTNYGPPEFLNFMYQSSIKK